MNKRKLYIIIVILTLLMLLIYYLSKKPYSSYKNLKYSRNLSMLIFNKLNYLDNFEDKLEKFKEFMVIDYESKKVQNEIDEQLIKKEVDIIKKDYVFLEMLKNNNVKLIDDELKYYVRVTLAIDRMEKRKNIANKNASKAIGIYIIEAKDEIDQEEIYKKLKAGEPMFSLSREFNTSAYPMNISDIDDIYVNNMSNFIDLFKQKKFYVNKSIILKNGVKEYIVYKVTDENTKEFVDKLNQINLEENQQLEFDKYIKEQSRYVITKLDRDF